MVITVYLQKGGETKTTTAVNLAAALVAQGMKGTLVNANPEQSSLAQFEGSLPGVAFVTEFPDTWTPEEFIIVDSAPSLTPEVAKALKHSDVVVMPLTPSPEAGKELANTFDTLGRAMEKGGDFHGLVVFTRIERSNRLAVDFARALTQWPVAQTTIPKKPFDFQEAFSLGIPLVLKSPRSVGAKAYIELTREIQRLVTNAATN